MQIVEQPRQLAQIGLADAPRPELLLPLLRQLLGDGVERAVVVRRHHPLPPRQERARIEGREREQEVREIAFDVDHEDRDLAPHGLLAEQAQPAPRTRRGAGMAGGSARRWSERWVAR